MRNSIWTAILLSCCFLWSCGNDSNSTEKPTVDSTASPAYPSGSGKAVERVKEGKMSFGEKVQAMCDSVFANYREQSMQQVDKMPRFERANQSIYRMYRSKDPIPIELNPQVYPRFWVKAYRFAEEKSADREVEEWLNGHESNPKIIRLGDPVKAFKSQPLYCALIGSQFVMVQTSCLYDHPVIDEARQRFFEWVRSQPDARIAWTVTCEAGKFAYEIGENTE